VLLAANRTRQIMKGSPALVRGNNKSAVMALREIADGKVRFHRESIEIVREWLDERGVEMR
jgi:DNA-directed RNA polymerase subunit omega